MNKAPLLYLAYIILKQQYNEEVTNCEKVIILDLESEDKNVEPKEKAENVPVKAWQLFTTMSSMQ